MTYVVLMSSGSTAHANVQLIGPFASENEARTWTYANATANWRFLTPIDPAVATIWKTEKS